MWRGRGEVLVIYLLGGTLYLNLGGEKRGGREGGRKKMKVGRKEERGSVGRERMGGREGLGKRKKKRC